MILSSGSVSAITSSTNAGTCAACKDGFLLFSDKSCVYGCKTEGTGDNAGKCTACNEWNSFFEEKVVNTKSSSSKGSKERIKPVSLNKIVCLKND